MFALKVIDNIFCTVQFFLFVCLFVCLRGTVTGIWFDCFTLLNHYCFVLFVMYFVEFGLYSLDNPFSSFYRTIGKHTQKSPFLILLMPYNVYTIVNPCSRLLPI